MRISDWSSDVCSSDLLRDRRGDFGNPSHADWPRVVRGDRLMSVIASKLRTGSDEFRANSSALRALVDELRDKTARTALGGSAKARQKHVARGKLRVSERIDSLVDPGPQFLEFHPLTPTGVYGRDGWTDEE